MHTYIHAPNHSYIRAYKHPSDKTKACKYSSAILYQLSYELSCNDSGNYFINGPLVLNDDALIPPHQSHRAFI